MKKRLLVIDNDIDMEDIVKEIFAGKNYVVDFYESATDIEKLIVTHNPDLILIDYNLDGVNGGELCKQVKASPKFQHIPVILFSAYPRIIYSLEHYGYDHFIEKPFDIDDLFNTIDGIIEGEEKTPE